MKFIITVDTEGDNGWTYCKGDVVHTENVIMLPRFQTLCNKYGYKPVYLTNYEMINDERYVDFVKGEQESGNCEIGIHIHAWNNPPIYELPKQKSDQSFLIEFPMEVMQLKFKETYGLIAQRIGVAPVSHRAGRWVINKPYFEMLEKFDIKVDCSYTPGVDWSNTWGANRVGPDYSKVSSDVNWIGKVLEVPMTIVDSGNKLSVSWKKKIKYMLKFKSVPHKVTWLRPALTDLEDMKFILDYYMKNGKDYVELMIHSSELLPDGNPYFRTKESVDGLFSTMDALFEYAHNNGFEGCTLKEFYEQKS